MPFKPAFNFGRGHSNTPVETSAYERSSENMGKRCFLLDFLAVMR
jgi:hypothetical protein